MDYCMNYWFELQRQSVAPDEIIISSSGLKNSDLTHSEELIIGDKIVPIVTVNKKKRHSEGEARNLGGENSRMEIIQYLDVDDIPHYQRTEFTKKVFAENDCDALVHHYMVVPRHKTPKRVENIFYNNFKEMTFSGDRVFECIVGDNGQLKIVWRDSVDKYANIAHGPISIKTKIKKKINYTTSSRGADCVFCKNVIKNNYKIFYYHDNLMHWRQEGFDWETMMKCKSIVGSLQKDGVEWVKLEKNLVISSESAKKLNLVEGKDMFKNVTIKDMTQLELGTKKYFHNLYLNADDTVRILKLHDELLETQNTTIWCWWTGDNQMSKNRKKCLNSMHQSMGGNLVFINKINLGRYILPEAPIHEGYQYLSPIQKGDYLKCYFMHHYGGGYSDIKKTEVSWAPYFDKINSNKDLYAIGYSEKHPNHVACLEDCRLDPTKSKYCRDFTLSEDGKSWSSHYLKTEWKKLIGNGSFICKKNTPLTLGWWNGLNEKMDGYLEELKKNPGKWGRDCYNHPNPDTGEKSKYPIAWAVLHGHIFHPLTLKHHKNIDQTLPYPEMGGYL